MYNLNVAFRISAYQFTTHVKTQNKKIIIICVIPPIKPICLRISAWCQMTNDSLRRRGEVQLGAA